MNSINKFMVWSAVPVALALAMAAPVRADDFVVEERYEVPVAADVVVSDYDDDPVIDDDDPGVIDDDDDVDDDVIETRRVVTRRTTIIDGDGDDAEARCSAQFRSFDPRSGTYIGYDGEAHMCPYLR